jgi:uncharacterized protein (TIGR03000 family)
MPKKAPQKTEAPAVIQVSLPADARLLVDGHATTSTSSQRTFITPALAMGQTFNYTLRAEVVREGRAVVETQQITVRGGEETPISFSLPAVEVASH